MDIRSGQEIVSYYHKISELFDFYNVYVFIFLNSENTELKSQMCFQLKKTILLCKGKFLSHMFIWDWFLIDWFLKVSHWPEINLLKCYSIHGIDFLSWLYKAKRHNSIHHQSPFMGISFKEWGFWPIYSQQILKKS